MILLPGHFFDMTGFPNTGWNRISGRLFDQCGCPGKYQFFFIYDVAAYLETLDKIASMEANMFVPSHAEATDDIRPLAELNRRKVYEIAERILSICRTPISFELILQQIFTEYQLTMTYEQYVLTGSTVRSYLSWLKDSEELDCCIDHNMLLWKSRN